VKDFSGDKEKREREFLRKGELVSIKGIGSSELIAS
jgi:hypothetical protein